MTKKLTIRVSKELRDWLAEISGEMGIPVSRLVREQIEKARREDGRPEFMRYAGIVRGPRDLSTRKGFTRS